MSKVKWILLFFIIVNYCFSAYSQNDTSCCNLLQINTSSDEYLPFLIDSTLIFTSNKKNTCEGQNLEFTEKVYWAIKEKGVWSEGKKYGYKWNSDNNTALVGISSMYYYLYRSYWKDNGEIFITKRGLEPKSLQKTNQIKKLSYICSDFDENSITSNKEDTMYFTSNRNGNYDIFMQTKADSAICLDILNSPLSEKDVFISSDNKTLYFSSDRVGGKGGYDIYKTTKINNKWTSPILVHGKDINTKFDDRDFRWYNDYTMFLSSNRENGLGGFDIYFISISNKKTIVKELVKDSSIVVDSIPIITNSLKQERNELIDKLKALDLFPFRGELQLGAYQQISSVLSFKKTFSCINKENIRIDTLKLEGSFFYKFIINKVFTDVNEAINIQIDIINRHCLPELDFKDMPFIGLLDKKGKRFAIFWKKDEFENKKVFYIYSNGKQIWKEGN